MRLLPGGGAPRLRIGVSGHDVQGGAAAQLTTEGLVVRLHPPTVGPRNYLSPSAPLIMAKATAEARRPEANATAPDRAPEKLAPTLADDVLAIHRALGDLLRTYQFRDRDRICCYDVSVTQCYALETVIRRGPLSLNELAARLYLDKSTASRVAGALERKGYVQRSRSSEDGRVLQLKATSAGAALHARIESDILERERRLLAQFPSEVRQSMAQLIGELARASASRIDTSAGTCCTVD